jgi:signal transduction histidine kinase
MENLYLTSLIAAVTSNFFLLYLLIRREDRSVIIVSFIALLICINFWGVSQLLVNLFDFQGETFIVIDKLSVLGYTFIPVTFFIFAVAFSQRLQLFRSYLFSLVFFAFPLAFLLIAWNTNLIESHKFSDVAKSGWGYVIKTGPIFPSIILWFEIVVWSGMFFIFRQYRASPSDSIRRQARWILIATLIPFVFGTFTNGLLPILGIRIFPLAIPLTSIMALIIAYALFKQDLFELTPVTILSSLGNGVITVDNNERIIQINVSALELLKLKPNTFPDVKFTEIIKLQKELKKDKHLEEKDLLLRVFKSGRKINSRDYFMSTKNRPKLPVGISVAPIFKGNQVVGATIVFRDISKEKELEKSKNEFIGIASHELKTPVTSIKSFGQLLEKRLSKSADKTSLFFVNRINEQLDKLIMLIHDLLDVNRIEEARLVLDKKTFNLYQLAEKVSKDLQFTASTQKIILEGSLDTNIHADEDRIRQVLINLISNAIKYSPGTKKILIKIFKFKGNINLSVIDFGPGIVKGEQEDIFKRFYRSRTNEEGTITGFGLGLYICSEIIKLHNGKLWVKSTPGSGSNFTFTLPQ